MLFKILTVGAAVLALAGCGSAPAHHTTKAKPSASHSVALHGPERFLAKVRAAGLGNKDVAGATDAQLLKIGQIACDGLDNGIAYQDQIYVFVSSPAKPTTRQATVLVDEAVRDLCPQDLSQIPAGAP